MKPSLDCPSPEVWREFAGAALAREAHEALDSHLETCATCQETLAALDGTRGALGHVLAGLAPQSAAAAGVPDGDPAYRRLIERAKAIRVTNDWQGAAASERCEGPAAALPPGTVLGAYVLGESIGAGGMGRVYKAVHQRMRRTVAVKVLSSRWLDCEEARGRFRREVESAARLSHPHVVTAFDAGEADGQHYLVMEYVPGRNLAEVVRQSGPLPLRAALEYLLQAARGLEHAHEMGIVHRDIKPGNLLLDDGGPHGGGIVKVLDMGIARAPWTEQPGGQGDLTAARALLGTAAFMAPEQAANARRVDHRADVYSLGCTLFYLLTGHNVYAGETAMEIVLAHREQPIPSLRGPRPDCPEAVDLLFQRMVAKRPEDRVASMREVAGELRRQLDDNSAEAIPIRNATLLAATVQATLPRAMRVPTMSGVWTFRAAATSALAAVVLAGIVLASLGKLPWPRSNLDGSATAEGDSNSDGDKTVEVIPIADKTAAPLAPKIEMVKVPEGKFQMGAADDDKEASADQKPRHEVRISRAFLLSKYEVTRDEFIEVMDLARDTKDSATNGATDDGAEHNERGRLPVVGVSWLTAVEFCNQLSLRHGLKPYYKVNGERVTIHPGGDGFRLPTEAEWEYACRAGTETKWHFGDDPRLLDQFEWHAGNSQGRPHPVGKRKANPWGLHDMHGNVPEWCWDRYDAAYYGRSEVDNPPGSSRGEQRVVRGGSASQHAAQTASASRTSLGVAYGIVEPKGAAPLPPAATVAPGSRGVGIRVARSLE